MTNIDKIASVYELKNAIIKNEMSGTQFDKKHILVIEDIRGNRICLDIDNGNDLTDTLMVVDVDRKKTKLKILFQNIAIG